MMIENVISRSLRLMFAGGMALSMHAAYAQETTDGTMQRVEVTGSSIKRIASEASLPVQSFNQKDIKKTGVTTVTDFIQQIPAMQGFSVAADSVGGGGGGVTTASIHDIGAAYTLVLLNGRRIAPSNSGTTIDLNSIPLSADRARRSADRRRLGPVRRRRHRRRGQLHPEKRRIAAGNQCQVFAS